MHGTHWWLQGAKSTLFMFGWQRALSSAWHRRVLWSLAPLCIPPVPPTYTPLSLLGLCSVLCMCVFVCMHLHVFGTMHVCCVLLCMCSLNHSEDMLYPAYHINETGSMDIKQCLISMSL